jgi:hypothetical protein
MNQARYFAVHLRSVNSPFWWRKYGAQRLSPESVERFPRTGIPDAFEPEHEDYCKLPVKTGCVDNAKNLVGHPATPILRYAEARAMPKHEWTTHWQRGIDPGNHCQVLNCSGETRRSGFTAVVF